MTSDFSEDNPTIALKDEFGQTLTCQIERVVEIEDRPYALLLPVDTPVEIFVWEEEESGEEESLADVDESQIEVLFPTARAVLAEQDLMLKRTAITLTVEGEIPEPQDEDCFTLEIEDEEDEAEELLASEEFQTLASFFHQDIEYAICTPVNPLLLFAQILPTGEGQIIPPQEFERLRPQIESILFDVLD